MDVLAVSQSTSRSLAALDDIAEGNIVKICKHVLQKLLTGSSSIAIGKTYLLQCLFHASEFDAFLV